MQPACRRLRTHQTRVCGEHATPAPAEVGGETHNVSSPSAGTGVARYGSGTFGAFWAYIPDLLPTRAPAGQPCAQQVPRPPRGSAAAHAERRAAHGAPGSPARCQAPVPAAEGRKAPGLERGFQEYC